MKMRKIMIDEIEIVAVSTELLYLLCDHCILHMRHDLRVSDLLLLLLLMLLLLIVLVLFSAGAALCVTAEIIVCFIARLTLAFLKFPLKTFQRTRFRGDTFFMSRITSDNNYLVPHSHTSII